MDTDMDITNLDAAALALIESLVTSDTSRLRLRTRGDAAATAPPIPERR